VEQRAEALNLTQVLAVLRRRTVLIVGCTLVVAIAAFGFSKLQTKEYTASASLIFHSDPLSQQIAGLPADTSTNQFVEQASNVALVELGDIAEKTAEKIGHGLTETYVRESISIMGEGESSVVTVSATDPSPVRAAQIATTYTHQFVREQQRAKGKFFASALALVNRQLNELPPGQRFGTAAVALQNRAQSLKLLQKLRADNVSVAQNASVPSAPSKPKTAKNTILGGLLGLLVGIALAFIFERFRRDRQIVDAADLERTYPGSPLLGVVPESPALRLPGPIGKSGESDTVQEAFRLIRARLRFSSQEREVRSLLITSAERGAGRTTVARGLAQAAATMGARTLLLEADLRNPSLGRELGLRPGPGLCDLLEGKATLAEAIQPVAIEPLGLGAHGATFDTLRAGTVPASGGPRPIDCHEMRFLLTTDLRSKYDLVVIDAPPLTVASDGFSLLSQVDGILVVGWIGRARRDAAAKLREILESASVPVLGTVANGAREEAGLAAYGEATSGAAPASEVTSSSSSASSSPVPTAET
jgi:capsular exopolysaccharide synthesis family protein